MTLADELDAMAEALEGTASRDCNMVLVPRTAGDLAALMRKAADELREYVPIERLKLGEQGNA